MTIGEAIRRNREIKRRGLKVPLDKEREAIQLGIEALNYIDTCQQNPNCYNISLLPGQTED